MIAAGEVGFFEDFHLEGGEHSLEVGSVSRAAAVLVDEDLKGSASELLEGALDMAAGEGEKDGGLVVDGLDHPVEFADGQDYGPELQEADMVFIHIVCEGGGGGGDVIGVVF